MSPADWIDLLFRLADSPHGRAVTHGDTRAREELVVLLNWHTCNLLKGIMAPSGIEEVRGALEPKLQHVTRSEIRTRCAAYQRASHDESDAGPMWHITRTFEGYARGTSTLVMGAVIDLTVNLAALMAGITKTIEGAASRGDTGGQTGCLVALLLLLGALGGLASFVGFVLAA